MARLVLVAVVVLLSSAAGAQTRLQEAKKEFLLGKQAYERGDFATAYDAFKRSYLLSQQPALLYNISSAQQGLGRPHDAAETLRDYLRAVPNDAERPDIEKRIAALEEAQWLLSRERESKLREEELQRRTIANVDATQKKRLEEELLKMRRDRDLESARLKEQMRAGEIKLLEERQRLKETELRLERERFEQQSLVRGIEEKTHEDKRRRRNIGIAVGVVGAVLVGTAVGLAIGLQKPIEHTPSDIGPITATP